MHTPPSSAALPSSSRLLVGRRPPLPLLRRSSSLRSRRSVTSTGSSSSATVATTASGSKRVSFHRDVRVKRIPSYLGERGRVGGSFRRRHKPLPPPDPSAGLVRRLDPPHSRQALAKEARKVLREADRVTCTTLPLPKQQGGKAAVPLLLLNRRKSRRAQPPPRLLITPPSPQSASPTPAVVTFSSEEGGGASTTDYSSLERPPRERRKKKALSPIIEAATPVIAPGDYFSSRSGERSISKEPVSDGALRNGREESSLESLKEDYREEEGEESDEEEGGGVGGGMKVHSSQMPAERPPLTRGTVSGLAQQLSVNRRVKGPPPAVGRSYVQPPDVYGSEDHIVNHNNNRPFSYTDPSAVQAALAKSGAQSRNGVDADGSGLDSRIPRGKEVIYAQVVVSGREGGGVSGGEGGGPASRAGGGVKRTVHTSVLNHQQGEKVPVLATESADRYVRSKGRKRLGSEGEEEEDEEEDYEEERTKNPGEEEEEDEGIAGDMMRISGGGAGGVTTSASYFNQRRTTSSRTANSGKVTDYIDGDYRNRRQGGSVQTQQKGGKVVDPRRIEHYKRYDEDDDDDLDRNYRRGSLDYGLSKSDNIGGKGLAYNRKDLFDSGIENDSGVGGSGRRRPKTGGKVVVGEGVTAKIVMNGGPNLRPNVIGGSCNNISRVTITNDSPPAPPVPKDRYFYYGASPEDTTTLTDKRRGSGAGSNKSTNAPSMASTRLVRAADKRRDADLPTSSVLIRHWAPSSDDKHEGQEQQLIVEESVVEQENYYHRRRRRRKAKGEEEEEEEVEEGTGPPPDEEDNGHWRRSRGKEKGRGRLEDLEEEEQRVNGKGGSHSEEEYDDRNNNTSVTGSNRRYQKKGEVVQKKKTAAVIEEEEHHGVDKKGKGKKGSKEDGEEGVKQQKKRGFMHLFSRGKSVKETEEKGGGEYQRTDYVSRRDRNDGYASAEDRRSHGHSTNHDPAGRQKDRWFSEDEIDRRGDRTPPSRRKNTDGHTSSATLSRLVANNNRKNKASAVTGSANDSGGRWFKSLDRLTRRKRKEDEEEDDAQESEVPVKESPPPRESNANAGNKKNLRFFGDTDQESVASANHTRRNGRRVGGIIASGRRSGASEEEESGTTTESSAPSQRSVYLHAATVGDIPGPPKTSAPAAPPASAALNKAARRKAGSREELSQRRPMVTSKTTLSRSVSVLAPWRPRYKPGSNVDVHYDNSGAYTPTPHGMVTGRPPKAPRTANGNGVKSSRGMSASVESLQRGGTKKSSPPRQVGSGVQRSSRESGSVLRGERRSGTSRRDVPKVGVERVSSNESSRQTSGTSVTRSASMPKDSRLAGWWFRRKKVGQAPGKENYGGSANRG